MQPCYRHDQYVLLLTTFSRRINIGDDIVCRHPSFGLILKRVLNIESGKVWLTGLNQLSTNSKLLGQIPLDSVVGKVIWCFK